MGRARGQAAAARLPVAALRFFLPAADASHATPQPRARMAHEGRFRLDLAPPPTAFTAPATVSDLLLLVAIRRYFRLLTPRAAVLEGRAPVAPILLGARARLLPPYRISRGASWRTLSWLQLCTAASVRALRCSGPSPRHRRWCFSSACAWCSTGGSIAPGAASSLHTRFCFCSAYAGQSAASPATSPYARPRSEPPSSPLSPPSSTTCRWPSIFRTRRQRRPSPRPRRQPSPTSSSSSQCSATSACRWCLTAAAVAVIHLHQALALGRPCHILLGISR
jgi:hypothetical protein